MIDGDVCVSLFSRFRCGPYPAMAEAGAYPVIEMDGRLFSRLGKEQLDNVLPEKGMRFYVKSIQEYIDSNKYSDVFYKLLLQDLQSVVDQDTIGSVSCHIGKMHAHSKGTACNSEEATKWYRKAAEQGYAEAQYRLGRFYMYGDGINNDR